MERCSNYVFKNGKISKNRIVVPPMASQTADNSGFVTDKTIEHYKRLSESGAGMIFVEYSFIHQSGKGEANQLGVQDDSKMEGLSKIASAIHNSDALAGLQLVHVGGKGNADVTGSELMGPSAVPVPVRGWTPDLPVEMTAQDIRNWKDWFREAALRAIQAGFDIIEIHAAHGYGLNQWLSPLTNLRQDEYGGDMKRRSRIFFEIIQSLRDLSPDILISARFPAQDNMPGGLTLEDMRYVALQAYKLGLDLLNVSSGIGGWRRLDGKSSEGYLVEDAHMIKTFTTLPVIGVGGIESGETVDRLLRERKVDFAAVGRSILKDPATWRDLNLNVARLKQAL